MIGSDLTLAWTGGSAPYTVDVLLNGSVIDTQAVTGTSLTYTTSQAGVYNFQVNDSSTLFAITTPTTVYEPLATVTDLPATANTGDKLTFSWTGGTAPYFVTVVHETDGTIVDNVDWGSQLEYEFDTTGHKTGKYIATVTDSSVPSQSISSTECDVLALLTLSTQPQDVTGLVGDDLELKVVATGGKTPYTYLWKYSNLDGSGVGDVTDGAAGSIGDAWSGQGTDTLKLINAKNDANTWLHFVVVTDDAGQSVTSNSAKMVVNVPVPPTLSTQPQKQALYQIGGKLEITGAVATPSTATFQWQKQSGTTWNNVSGQTSAVLTIAAGAVADEGKYKLVVTNDGLTVESNEVDVVAVYLSIQNDINGQTDPVQSDEQNYDCIIAPGGRYIGAYYVKHGDPMDHFFTPEGAAGGRAAATWSTSNQTVAPVAGDGTPGSATSSSNGVQSSGQLVSPLTVGTATLTAKIGNLESKLALNVKRVVTSVTIPEGDRGVAPGGTLQLTANIAPTNATHKEVTWSSSNSAVADVSSTGLVSVPANATLGDTATITVTSVDDNTKTDSVVITVGETSPVLTLDTAAMALGETDIARGLFTANPLPPGLTHDQVDEMHQFFRDTWDITSSDTSVMTVQLTPTVVIVWGAGVADGASADLIFDYKEDLGNQIQRFTIVKHPSP